MGAIQKSLGAINTQLADLTSTAKMLIGSLMVILTMSLFFVAQYAGRPAMVPLSINMDVDAKTAVIAYLERSNIRHDDTGTRLLVPAEQRYTVLAHLTEQEVITGDQITFDSLIENDSPFLTRDQNDRRWLIAKMNVLSALISRFDGIRRATVVIDKPRETGFARTHVRPSAMVTVTPRGDGLSASQVEAIAHVVASSEAGLKPQDVRVIDSKRGTSHQAPNDDEMTTDKYLEIKRAAEKHVKTTIEDLLAYIPGVRIGVNALMATARVEGHTEAYEDPKVGPLESSSRTIESTSRSTSQEAGFQPNTGAAVAPSGARGTQLTDERTSEKTRPKFPRDIRRYVDHKGYALEMNATILVPRSYFLSLYRMERNDPEAAPSEAELEPIVTAETTRIRADVEPIVDTGAFEDAVPGTVVVSMIPDITTMATTATLAPSMGSGIVQGGDDPIGMGLPGGLIKYIGLVGLALLSLAMMFLMVRRAGVHAELPSAEEIVGVPPPLPTDQSEVVGEAEESAPAMEGVELDDAALQRKQMLNQISDMVKQNPDEVANLLRRWIRIEA